MDNTVIVLGNGFDLDLGLKTSYKDFMWHINARNPNLVYPRNKIVNSLLNKWMDKGRHENKWNIDLEGQLRKWALGEEKDKNPLLDNSDAENEYIELCRELNYYMCIEKFPASDVLGNTYNLKSCALNLLKYISSSNIGVEIFSLNYTSLTKISASINRKLSDDVIELLNIPITNIHGIARSVPEKEDPPIILGIDENDEIPERLHFLFKTRNKNYSDGVSLAVDNAKNVIFFGVGFGITDEPYFKGFFNKVLNKESGNIRVFVFTRGDGTDFFYRVSQMIGGENLPAFREKEIYIYNTTQKDAYNNFLKDFDNE